jgi:hypothetical protein
VRGLFREGRTEADISCLVEVGAALTVKERGSGGIRFEKFRPFDVDKLDFDAARLADAAE